jgi:hypothetical protein
MSPDVSESELRKLVAIMERATGSPFDKERLVALSMAQKLLAAHRLLWRNVLHAEPEYVAPRHWKQSAQEVLQTHMAAITAWEQDFLINLITKAHQLSPKREAILKELCLRFGVEPWVTVL